MFRPFIRGVGIAISPQGRKVIGHAIAAARSDEARLVMGHARRLATSPQSKRIVGGALRTATHAGRTIATPENVDRLRTAVRYIADRRP